MLEKLIHNQDNDFKDWVNIDSGEINTIDPKDVDKAITTIKTLYTQMHDTNTSHIRGAKGRQRDDDLAQYKTDYDKAKAAYDAAVKAGS